MTVHVTWLRCLNKRNGSLLSVRPEPLSVRTRAWHLGASKPGLRCPPVDAVHPSSLHLVLMPRKMHAWKLPVTLGKFGRWCLFSLSFFFFSNFPPETPAPGPWLPSSIPFLLIDLISSMLNKRSPFCVRCSDKRSPAVDHQNKQLRPIQLQGWALAFIWLWHHFNQNVK